MDFDGLNTKTETMRLGNKIAKSDGRGWREGHPDILTFHATLRARKIIDHPFTLDPPGGRKLTIWSMEATDLRYLRSSSFSAKDR